MNSEIAIDAPILATRTHSGSALWALFKREILRFVRQRSRWIGALATPLLFWLLVGGGLGSSFSDPSGLSGGYLEFFYPGSILLSVLFTAIFSTMSVIEDRHQGFLQGVLVSPVSRDTIVYSKILGGAALGVLQGVLLLSLAPFIGIKLTVLSFAIAIFLLFLMASALTSLGFYFAWIIDSTQGYHGVMNIVFIPMWILSGAVFPSEAATSSRIFYWAAKLNPLSYGLKALRLVLSPDPGALTPSIFLQAVVVMGVMTLALVFLCRRCLKPVSGSRL